MIPVLLSYLEWLRERLGRIGQEHQPSRGAGARLPE